MGGLIGIATPGNDGLVNKNEAHKMFYIPSYIDFPNLMSKISSATYFSCFLSVIADGVSPAIYLISKYNSIVLVKLILNSSDYNFNVKFKIDTSGNIYISRNYAGGNANIIPIYNTSPYLTVERLDISSLSLTDINVG